MIRRYRQSDLVNLVRWGGTAVSPTILHANLERAFQNWVFEQAGRPVGFGFVTAVPGLAGLYELHGAVAPSMRCRGVGSQLLARMLVDLKNTAVQHLSFATPYLDTPSALFLQHHKFAIEHTEWEMAYKLDQLNNSTPQSPQLGLTVVPIAIHQIIDLLPNLYDRCFKGLSWYQPYSLAEIQQITQDSDQFLLLKEGRETAGFVWIHLPEPNLAEIEPVGIVPNRRGKGYGRFFLHSILKMQKRAGKTAVSLGVWEANQPAIALYQSVGFQKWREVVYLQRAI